MIYQTKLSEVEAVPVLLGQHELYAIAVDGKTLLISAEAFRALFRDNARVPVSTADVPAARVEASKARPAATKQYTPRAKVLATVSDAGARVLSTLAFSPLTTAELGDHVYPDQKDSKLRYQNAWAVCRKLVPLGKIERREHNGVDKWHLK